MHCHRFPRRLAAVATTAVFVLAACGSSTDQERLTASLIAEADAQGFEIDEACASEIASNFSDEDAKLLIEADDDTDLEDIGLSAAGEQNAVSVLQCVDPEAFADEFVKGMQESGLNVDEECARGLVEDIDFANFDMNNPSDELISAVIACVQE